jgi:hypothetical protein
MGFLPGWPDSDVMTHQWQAVASAAIIASSRLWSPPVAARRLDKIMKKVATEYGIVEATVPLHVGCSMNLEDKACKKRPKASCGGQVLVFKYFSNEGDM